MTTRLSLDQLRKFVECDVVAIRGKATLQPAGGRGDKIFPPTHSIEERNKTAGAKYAFEKRRMPGGDIADCVLLDSVQSQANRMEEALQGLWSAKKIALPVISISFADIAPEVGVVTSLSAPHRIADALLRDSMHEGDLFRVSPLGKSFTDASPRNAGSLFKVCPTALVFGLWDSTGPKGGLGSKFARAITSEIVGIGAVRGVKTSSRIDPAGIMRDAATIFIAKDPDRDGNSTWTPTESEALPEKERLGKQPAQSVEAPQGQKWGGSDSKGKPSAILHGNIPPSIEEIAGGVTIEYAIHTVVLSLAGLRRVGFAKGGNEARTVLAALGLVAILAADASGHDLRSRCLLIPQDRDSRMHFESVASDGTSTPFEVSLDEAIAIYSDAVAALPQELSFRPWGQDQKLLPGENIAELIPSEKLKYLLKESRKLAAYGAVPAGD